MVTIMAPATATMVDMSTPLALSLLQAMVAVVFARRSAGPPLARGRPSMPVIP